MSNIFDFKKESESRRYKMIKNNISTEKIEEIENSVKNLFSTYDIKDKTKVPVIFIAQQLGFTVCERNDMPDTLLGLMAIDPQNDKLIEIYKSDKVICVNSGYDDKHKRFTIAHELGHYIMEYTPENPKMEDQYFIVAHEKDNEYGNEGIACKFASLLLMEKDTFTSYFTNLTSKYKPTEVNYKLANSFNTTIKSVERRIKQLVLSYDYR